MIFVSIFFQVYLKIASKLELNIHLYQMTKKMMDLRYVSHVSSPSQSHEKHMHYPGVGVGVGIGVGVYIYV